MNNAESNRPVVRNPTDYLQVYNCKLNEKGAMLCECCEEREVWKIAMEHGCPYCEKCSYTTRCDTEHCCYLTEPRPVWESAYCERCQERHRRWEEEEEGEKELERQRQQEEKEEEEEEEEEQ